MKLKLTEVYEINNGVGELLEYELPTHFVFKLIKIQKEVSNLLAVAVETINKKIEDGMSEEQANKDLLKETIDVEIEKINISDLPETIKGSIAHNLIPIIEMEE